MASIMRVDPISPIIVVEARAKKMQMMPSVPPGQDNQVNIDYSKCPLNSLK